MSEKMKENNKECVVIQPNTGTEADMLGQILLWVDKRQNSKYPQRPHRTYKRRQPKSISELYIRVAVIRAWSASNELAKSCWRRLKLFMDKKDADVPKYLQGVRKQKRNGN